jgi:hypothetical protein
MAAGCLARETVYLTSGFSIAADSHSEADGIYVLHVGSGTLEYPAAQIREIVLIAEAAEEPKKQRGIGMPEPKTILNSAAQTQGVDELFVRSVAKVESGFRQDAVSPKGALGLMQLMPNTASDLGVDPHQPDQNAIGGVRYLRTLLERYNYNPVLALAAYNAGPAAVSKYKGVPPYFETRAYVVRVLKEYERELRIAGIRPDTVGPQAPKTPIATN